MAKEGSEKSLENALASVNSGRRGFLRGMLIGGAALAALPLITSTNVAAQDDTTTAKKKKKKGTDSTELHSANGSSVPQR